MHEQGYFFYWGFLLSDTSSNSFRHLRDTTQVRARILSFLNISFDPVALTFCILTDSFQSWGD